LNEIISKLQINIDKLLLSDTNNKNILNENKDTINEIQRLLRENNKKIIESEKNNKLMNM